MLGAGGPRDALWGRGGGRTELPAAPLCSSFTPHAACGAEGRDAVLGSAWGARREPLIWRSLRSCVWAAKPCVPEDLLLPLLVAAPC